ncbi:hypothetical protein SAMN05446934_4129 [Paraburkholderia hospita]|nr:hypothetical protein SAMN05446934_4129 [Paraburkholderia hospita]
MRVFPSLYAWSFSAQGIIVHTLRVRFRSEIRLLA